MSTACRFSSQFHGTNIHFLSPCVPLLDACVCIVYCLFQMKYGGHGYSHILLNVVPMMRLRGVQEDVISKILVDNPKKWLTFK